MTLYQDIANQLTDRIQNGVYLTGTRLPGVRQLSKQFGVSVSTVVQAQHQLENIGLIEARPRSGYYVCAYAKQYLDIPESSTPDGIPTAVTGQELAFQLAQAANHDDFVALGAAVPHGDFLPLRAFQRSLSKVTRQFGMRAANYAFPPGTPELQQQIARRMFLAGSKINPEHIIITNGCSEALSFAVQSVAQRGDIVAVESPAFYGLLQVLDSMGIKALEIPTDPETGMSIEALQLALDQWNIKACIVIPNISNPLGSIMPDSHKQALIELANRYDLTLIEDGIYSELNHSATSLRSLHSFDTENRVIYCSSFSKTISPGMRIGWIATKQHEQALEYMKYTANLSAATLPQLAIAHYLEQGGYDRYLRKAKVDYAQQINRFSQAIARYFPDNTRATQPKGGFLLWIELDPRVDGFKLCQTLLQEQISIAPGQIFSASGKYKHWIRLNCAQPWSERTEQALKLLGNKVHQAII